MGFAMLDGLPFGRAGQRATASWPSPAPTSRYMAYVGVGWAMARLPRFRWPKLEAWTRCCAGWCSTATASTRPTSTPAKYVTRPVPGPPVPVAGRPAGLDANHAIDQGIGRAAWFVCGTDPDRVAELFDSFAPKRRADLYSRRRTGRDLRGRGRREEDLRAGPAGRRAPPEAGPGRRVRRGGPGAGRASCRAHRAGHRDALRRHPGGGRPADPGRAPGRWGRGTTAGLRGVAAAHRRPVRLPGRDQP